jgi:hypothetical protein
MPGLPTANYKLQTRLLGMPLIEGVQSGENLAPLVVKTIQDYGFNKEFRFVTGDNLRVNDVCLQRVYALLRVDHGVPAQDLARTFRVRCLGHILNLGAEAFLEGKSKGLFDQEEHESDEFTEVQGRLGEWRKRGPLGKLHNVVTWIRGSPQRRQAFLGTQHALQAGRDLLDQDQRHLPLMVIKDQATRWNSAYNIIQRALKLRIFINIYLQSNQKKGDASKRMPAEDILTTEDWVVLADLAKILQRFKRLTKHLEARGEGGLLAQRAPLLYWLVDTLKHSREVYISRRAPGSLAGVDQGAVGSGVTITTLLTPCPTSRSRPPVRSDKPTTRRSSRVCSSSIVSQDRLSI